MADIRDMGFGLNFNQGFGSRGGFVASRGGGSDPSAGADWNLRFGREADLQRELAGMQQAGENQRAALAASASRYPATLKQQRFNQVSPWLNALYSQPGEGGQSTQGPAIDASPIWNDQQIQGRVNLMRGQNDATTQGRIRTSQADLAGRGFGANSPLAQALGTQYQAANLATNTGAENDLRWTAAQGNKEFVLKAQTEQEQQHANAMMEDIERRKINAQRQNAIIAAMAGIV